jgi:hypothetical protein
MTTAYFFGNLILITGSFVTTAYVLNDETVILAAKLCEKNVNAMLKKTVFYEL